MKNSIIILLLSSLVLTGCFEKKDATEVEGENNPELIQIEDTQAETNKDVELEENENTETWNTDSTDTEVSQEIEVETETNSEAPVITPLEGSASTTEAQTEPTPAKQDTTVSEETTSSTQTEPAQTEPVQTESTPSTPTPTASTASSTQVTASNDTQAEKEVIEEFDEDLEELFKELLQ